MARGGADGGRKAKVAARRPTNESSVLGSNEELLPGLPDQIALDHIVPKLPWRTAVRVLASVSGLWRQAIRSHQVHDARVRANSTEKLVVLNYTDDGNGDHVISLFSARDGSDGSWPQLPRYPKAHKSQKGVPSDCQCVSLDGKIYILGGRKEYRSDESDDSDDGDESEDGDKKCGAEDHGGNRISSEVYVLDVAGHGRWKQCASMPQARSCFGCGVLDGKIYVLGGLNSSHKAARESLVYDPKENAWSSVRPMNCGRSHPHVLTVGEELFVHGGHFLDDKREEPLFTEIFHPGRDEWRSLEPFGCHKSELLFNAKGKIHMITQLGIYGHDIVGRDGKYSWRLKQTFIFEDELLSEDELHVCAVEEVRGELLGLLCFSDGRECQTGLCQSRGFGSEVEDMLWDTLPSKVLVFSQYNHFMCPIQL